MDRGLVTVIGMTISYVFSLLGLGLAWAAWRRRARAEGGADAPERTEVEP